MNRTAKILVFILVWFLFIASLNASVSSQAGLYPLPRVTYSFHDGTALSRMTFTTSEARLFYSFIPADSDPAQKPLFLFFNGGPGSGTSCGLMGFYTGHKSLDNRILGGGDRYIDNPWSWTQMGNLLYIDARCAGFSYGILPPATPRNTASLSSEFLGRNFNSYIDAADYIRVLLAFLADNPELQDNPVIIVGESYGGVRATLMLNMLLHYPQHGNGSDIYQDAELVRLIQSHLDRVFPEYGGDEVPAERIAWQFGHQILIQPAIDSYRDIFDGPMLEQPGSIVYQIAEETGTTFVPCSGTGCDPMSNIYHFIERIAGRDPYGCHKPAGWTDSFFDHSADLLLNSEQFRALTGFDPGAIAELRPQARTRAYKYNYYTPRTAAGLLPRHEEIRPFLSSDQRFFIRPRTRFGSDKTGYSELFHIPSEFGPLLDFDCYYSSSTTDGFVAYHYLNATASRGYASASYHPLTGEKFLQNLVDVKTFITNAKYDLVVYTNALPQALAMHGNLVTRATHQRHLPLDAARPGLIEVQYRPGALSQTEQAMRTIRFPYYTQSSHPVSLTEPQAFFEDVREWLSGEAR